MEFTIIQNALEDQLIALKFNGDKYYLRYDLTHDDEDKVVYSYGFLSDWYEEKLVCYSDDTLYKLEAAKTKLDQMIAKKKKLEKDGDIIESLFYEIMKEASKDKYTLRF